MEIFTCPKFIAVDGDTTYIYEGEEWKQYYGVKPAIMTTVTSDVLQTLPPIDTDDINSVTLDDIEEHVPLTNCPECDDDGCDTCIGSECDCDSCFGGCIC